MVVSGKIVSVVEEIRHGKRPLECCKHLERPLVNNRKIVILSEIFLGGMPGMEHRKPVWMVDLKICISQ